MMGARLILYVVMACMLMSTTWSLEPGPWPAAGPVGAAQRITQQLQAAPGHSPMRVILDHDGGVDDFITLLLLLSKRPALELVGVTLIGADSMPYVALNTTLKLLHTLGAGHVPVALSTLPGVNPFPEHWRWQGRRLEVLPTLNQHPHSNTPHQLPAQEFLLKLLQQQEDPVTIVATGPLSNVAYALTQGGPAVAAKVAAVWWMGGALGVRGNVDPQPGSSDGSAEWNAFWDPPGAAAVWGAGVPLLLVPLDATNTVPITRDLLYRFGPQVGRRLSLLAGTMWATVVTWDSERPGLPYYAWDTLTAACALAPPGSSMCTLRHGLLTAVCLQGPQQGRTVWLHQSSSSRSSSSSSSSSSSKSGHSWQEHDWLLAGAPSWAADAAAEACGCSGVLQRHMGTVAGEDARSGSSSSSGGGGSGAGEHARWHDRVQAPADTDGSVIQPGQAATACVSKVSVVSAVLAADPSSFEDFVLAALNQ